MSDPMKSRGELIDDLEEATQAHEKAAAAAERHKSKLKELAGVYDKAIKVNKQNVELLKQEEKRLEKAAKAAKKTDTAIVALVAKFAALSAAAGMVARGFGRIRDAMISVGSESASLAIRFKEQEDRLRNMFNEGPARKLAQTLVGDVKRAFELSTLESQRLVSSIADLSTSMHFTEDSSVKLSAAVIMLAGDLTSFQDRAEGIQGTAERITKSLIGNRRALKDLSISVNENDKRFRKLKMAFMAGTDQAENMAVVLKNARGENKQLFKTMFEATRLTETQAKALTTLVMAYEQSQHAISDYSRTHASAANQIRAFHAAVEDLKLAFGKTIMTQLKLDKVMKALVSTVRIVTQFWEKLHDGEKATLIIIAGVIMAIATLAAVITAVVTVLGAVAAAAGALGITLGTVGTVIFGVVVGIGALIVQFGVFLMLLGKGETLVDRLADGFEIFTTWILMAVGFLFNLGHNFDLITSWMGVQWAKFTMAFEFGIKLMIRKAEDFFTRLMNVKDAIEAFARTGDKQFAARVLNMGVKGTGDLDQQIAARLNALKQIEKDLGVQEGFQFKLDIGGVPPSLKAVMDRFGKFKPRGDIAAPVAKLPAAQLEGSVQAAQIIAASAGNDIMERNLAANEATAENTKEAAKNSKKKPPVANP